jgi:hypothetical protein
VRVLSHVTAAAYSSKRAGARLLSGAIQEIGINTYVLSPPAKSKLRFFV